MDWISVADRLPKGEVPVIIFVNKVYRDEGKTRRLRAQWCPRFTVPQTDEDTCGTGEYSAEKDEYFLKEGWYESNEFEEIHWRIDGEVTHWQPLPPPPEVK